jgi:hypothetical protein
VAHTGTAARACAATTPPDSPKRAISPAGQQVIRAVQQTTHQRNRLRALVAELLRSAEPTPTGAVVHLSRP